MSNTTIKPDKNIGIIRINPAGFGFFTPLNSPKTNGVYSRKDSLYVGGTLLKGICDGDVVTVVSGTNGIEKVSLSSRTRKYFIGSVSADGKSVTMDPGLGRGTFSLTERQTPDVTVRFTINKKQAKVTKIVGANYSAAEIYERFMYRFNLPSEPVHMHVNAAANLVKSVKTKNRYLHLRRNLKNLTTITIDGEETVDIDDALSAELCSDGAIRVWVHIADVAEYISENSYLDQECRKIPTSTYSSYGVRHMLPEALSTEAISLLAGKDRMVLCVEFVISSNGQVVSTDVYHASIRSNKRVSYNEVEKLLVGTSSITDKNVVQLIRVLRTAAQRLSVTRDARAGVDTFREDSEGEARGMIERLMVCANESVAKWMKVRNIPVPRRAHATLSDASVVAIEKALSAMDIIAHLSKPVSPVALMAALKQVEEGHKLRSMLKLINRELGRAYYTFDEDSHFGLGSDDYLHFTSPIRRYPDLMVHRLIKKYLRDVHIGDRSFKDSVKQLTPILEHVNSIANEVSGAENALAAAKGISLLAVGEVYRGTINSSRGAESTIYLDNTGVTATIASKHNPGTKMKVRVKSANLHTLEVIVNEA